MKKTLIMSILLLLGFTSSSVEAQNVSPIWFWAWRSYDMDVENIPTDQRGDVITYTGYGETNILLENVFPIGLQRMSNSTAFVAGKIDKDYSLYYLTPNEAVYITALFDQNYVDERRNYAIYSGFEYYMPDIIPAGDSTFLIADRRQDNYFLFDVETQAIQILDLRAWCYDECIRISEDGRYIRYRVSAYDSLVPSAIYNEGENELPYQLYEYDTFTGIETLFYEQLFIEYIEGMQRPPQANCTPDKFGERWYCEIFIEDPDTPGWLPDEQIIVHHTGETQTINPNLHLRSLNNEWYFLDLYRDLVPINGCASCVITVYDSYTFDPISAFEIPSSESTSFEYVDQIISDRVQLISESIIGFGFPYPSSKAYIMTFESEIIEIGYRHCCSDPISMDFYDYKTGFVVSVNQENEDANYKTQLWNTTIPELIAEFPVEVNPGIDSTFRDYSLVLYGRLTFHVYSHLDETLYEIVYSAENPRNYIDAFHGGFILASYGNELEYGLLVNGDWSAAGSGYQLENDGIYVWTPEHGEQLLIDRAIPIPD
ncbi:MAG: hypothetical protein AAF846_12155 [Chloroflexota bacterium]